MHQIMWHNYHVTNDPTLCLNNHEIEREFKRILEHNIIMVKNKLLHKINSQNLSQLGFLNHHLSCLSLIILTDTQSCMCTCTS